MPYVLGFCYRSTPLLGTNFFISYCCCKTKHPILNKTIICVLLMTHDMYVGKYEQGSAGQNIACLGCSLWQRKGSTSCVGWLRGATRRLSHMSLVIKLASLGLLTQWWWQGSKMSQRGPAPMCKHSSSLCYGTFIVVPLVKANHRARARSDWLWERIMQGLTLREEMNSERCGQIWGALIATIY